MRLLTTASLIPSLPCRSSLASGWSRVAPLFAAVLILAGGCGSKSHTKPADAAPSDANKVTDASQQDLKGGSCSVCIYPWTGESSKCPASAPASEAELEALCNAFGVDALLAVGPCSPADYLLEGCEHTVADPDDLVLSASYGTHGSDCHYSRTTGQFIGTSATADTNTFCGGTAILTASEGLKNPRCRASTPAITFDCTSLAPWMRPDSGKLRKYDARGDAPELDTSLSNPQDAHATDSL